MKISEELAQFRIANDSNYLGSSAEIQCLTVRFMSPTALNSLPFMNGFKHILKQALLRQIQIHILTQKMQFKSVAEIEETVK